MNRGAPTLILVLLAAIGAVFFLAGFLDIVVLMGHHIPQKDMATDYLIGACWALFLGLSILVWPVTAKDKKPLMLAWAAKCVVALGFMLIYENHYPTDAFAYYESGKSEFFTWEMFKIGDGTQNIERLTFLYSRVFPDSYHMMKISFAMIGFIALYLIYRAGVLFTQKEDNRIFYVMMLFPSHIFWSSIIGKDPVILLGIALYVYGVAGWYRTDKYRYLALIALGIFETSFIRVWIATILIAPLSIFFLARIRGVLSRFVFIGLVLFGFGWAHQRFKQRFNIETNEDLVTAADVTSQSWAYGGSAQLREGSFDSFRDLMLFLPVGATSALLRPLPGEVLNLFGLLAGIENLTFVIILAFAAFRTRWQDLLDPMVLWAIALVFFWATTYSFASYQNLGTAARFKLQIMPVFLGLVMYLSRRRAAAARLPAVRG
ncbi:MAG: hypothetical protein HY748_00730 [Elusimicrobia bacterium]|nr:hypothetical protein [Elusimicrobiota bacterium]